MISVATHKNPNLGADWACALPTTSTQLLKSAISADDASKPMAQRMAKRLDKQIFLSLDLPQTDQTHLIQFKAEKALIKILTEQDQSI